jgi:hypothetical protein
MQPDQAAGIARSEFMSACAAEERVMRCVDGFILHTSAEGGFCSDHGGVDRQIAIVDG